MPATTDTLEALTQVYGLAATDILHLMRDPDLPGRVDRKIAAAAFCAAVAGGRSLADLYIFDSVTSGARAYVALGAAGAIGANDFAIVVPLFEVPTSTPATSWAGIAGLSNINNSAFDAGKFGISAFIDDANGLSLLLNAGSLADFRRSRVSGFRTTFSGQIGPLVWGRQSGVMFAYFCGVALTLGVDSTAGSAPAWSSAIDATYLLVGVHGSAERHLGRMSVPVLLNYALPSVDVLVHALTGRLPSSCDVASGSMVAHWSLTNPSFETDTASPPANWAASGNHVATAVIDGTAPGGGNVCEVVASAAGTYNSGSDNLQQSFGASAAIGARVGFDFWAKSVSGSTTLNVSPGGGNEVKTYTLTAAWQKFRYETTQASGWGFLRIALAAAGTFRVDAFSPLLKLGQIVKPGLQDGTYQSGRDMGANGLDFTHTAGVSVIVDGKRRPQVRAKNVNVGTAAYLIQSADILFPGWDVDCIQITNNAGASAVDVKVQLSDGTNHTDLMAIATIAAGATSLFYPSVGGLDTRRRLRCVAASGASDLTFNFSLRKRA